MALGDSTKGVENAKLDSWVYPRILSIADEYFDRIKFHEVQ